MQSENIAPEKLSRTRQARRQDILMATILVINRDGYAGASVEKIAREAHTSKGTVLYHFKSKEALNRALVGSIFEEGAAYIAPYILKSQDSSEKLNNYLISNLRFIVDHVEVIAALQQIEKNMLRKEFESSSEHIEGDAPVRWLEEMLAEAQRAGEFGEFDAHVMAISIRLVIDSAPHYILTHPAIDTEHYIAEIVQLFSRAVKRNEPGE